MEELIRYEKASSFIRVNIMSLFLQNTFQMVLATDGSLSYALILYTDIQWSQSISDGSGSGSGSGNILDLRLKLGMHYRVL